MENSNQPLCDEHHTQASTKRKRKNAARDEKQREALKKRRAWLAAIAADAEVSGSAFKVAWVIESFISIETGEAWPSQSLIAERAGMTERAVRKHLTALRDRGWLEILSGQERTRSRSVRGLHYKPRWSRRETAERDGTSDASPSSHRRQTGTDVPLSNRNDRSGLNRNNQVAKPERSGRRTGTTVPVPYESDRSPIESEPRRSAVPEGSNSIKVESPDAPSWARPPLPGEKGSHHPAGQKDSRQGRDDVYDDIPPPEDPFAGWEPVLEPPPSFDDVGDLDSGGTEDTTDEEYARQLLDDFETLPEVVDSNDWRQVLAFDDGFTAAGSKRQREIPDQFRMSKQLARAWLAGFDDFAVREAEGRVPDNFIAF